MRSNCKAWLLAAAATSLVFILVTPDLYGQAAPPSGSPESATSDGTDQTEEDVIEVAWDYDPYRVLVWVASDDPSINADSLDASLRSFLDRDFAAVWRLDLADAPAAVASSAKRNIDNLSFDTITASDPVLAVKRDHPDAVRIRSQATAAQYVSKVLGTADGIQEIKRKGAASGDDTVGGVMAKCEPVAGDAIAVKEQWANPDTEALLLSRGMALTLTEPDAKLVTLEIADLVAEAIDQYDKIFIVQIGSDTIPMQVEVTELDTLMHHFGPVARTEAATIGVLEAAVGRGITKAFAPVVRIENAGQRNAVGLLRAGGLIRERFRESSPASINVGDVLEPMTRKNDRNGKPILIGPMDFAFLHVSELTGHQGRNIEMDFYSGRAGGLQGRKNKRTFRTALKVRPFGRDTMLRLHLQKDPDFPLIGYELYDKELSSTKMTFIDRTDWDGRMLVEPNDTPLRLLYVKNGGAVLARLPIVPGLYPKVVADLRGDDMRLQAEAYIRGVQNSIIDLVAIRELFKARVRLRLEKGQMEKAEELMNALRDQPTSERLYDDIGKKHTVFINALGSGNANQRRMVDEMFSTTRELLAKHINPKLIRDLEADMISARNNDGKLPVKKDADDAPEPAPAKEPDPEPSADT